MVRVTHAHPVALRLASLLAFALAALAAEPARAVVGGSPARAGEAPWAVALISGRDDRLATGHFCGGALVARDTVLTAAHCLAKGEDEFAEGRRGREHENEQARRHRVTLAAFAGRVLPLRSGTVHRAAWTALHPAFDDGAGYANADVAVIRLRAPVRGAVPIALPTAAQGVGFDAGQSLVIYGWGNRSGREQRENLPRDLHRGEVTALPDARCDELYGRMFNPAAQLCAGRADGAVDSCNGDSGGPLVARRSDGRPLLVGIVSYGEGCGEPEFPGVYARVGRYRRWLADTIGATRRPRGAVRVPRR
jgi:trypsin